MLDLVLDQNGVHYSTPLENFERSVISLFDKSITATHNVPRLEKVILTMHLFVTSVTQQKSNSSSSLVHSS